jgi:hypothetical protein
MKNADRAAKYFERTFNYTLRETKLAKARPVRSLSFSPRSQRVFSAVEAFKRRVRRELPQSKP